MAATAGRRERSRRVKFPDQMCGISRSDDEINAIRMEIRGFSIEIGADHV
jgi:hypothetical protein